MIEKVKLNIQQAAQTYQSHNFKKALRQYENCITECFKIQESQSKGILYNLYSSKAGIETALNMLEEALKSVGLVLKNDPYHLPCLIRRSQIYKKQNKFKKAMEDLNTISMFSPDNLQVAAYKMQIQALMSKEKISNNSSEQEEEEEDEQAKLRFSNLKLIDRKSVRTSIQKTSLSSQRKSMVTISGDTTIYYESNQPSQIKNQAKIRLSKQEINKKIFQIERQLQDDNKKADQYKNQNTKIKVTDTFSRNKSILKNKQSNLYVNLNSQSNPENGRKSKILQKINNIDGKIIKQQSNEQNPNEEREVKFRKSLFEGEVLKKSKPNGRQSCLKRTSFNIPIQKNLQPMRKSRFQMISKSNIDGNLIKKQKKHTNKENQVAEDSSSCQNDNESSYNIYGNDQSIREIFSLDSEKIENGSKEKKTREAGKSILKRSSFVNQVQANLKNQTSNETANNSHKSKKSVMFQNKI